MGHVACLFHGFYQVPFGHALQDTERKQCLCRGVRRARDNERGTLLPGDIQQVSNQFGSAVVKVGGTGEIEDVVVVALDVSADDIHELRGRRHGDPL